ncbi:MAG: hypothetical protein MJ136_03540 [Clostridia bacterium]|nr:hypothetical protein [Clostridia bacterium]
MKNKLKENFTRVIIRPTIYMTLTRFPVALLIVLLADFFLPTSLTRIKTNGCAFFGVLFLLMAWVAWLRMDGMHLPKPMMMRLNLRKKPMISSYGDMIDHIDERPEAFEDLQEGEKDACCLIADLICAAAMIIISLYIV